MSCWRPERIVGYSAEMDLLRTCKLDFGAHQLTFLLVLEVGATLYLLYTQ